ncbi:hypothetical protein ACFFRR_008700 [Megaselia abdita]
MCCDGDDDDDKIDFSNIDFPESRLWIIIPSWEIIVKVSTFVPIILFGLAFNLIIIILVAKNKSLRTPTNLLIANMASADFLTLLIGPILFMIHDFYQNYELGAVGCRLEGFLEGAFLVTAVLNLSAISYDRLSSIVLPMYSKFKLNVKRTKIVMAITWMIGFSFAIPLAVFRKYKQRIWKNFVEKYCKENQNVLPEYWYVLISVLVWLPLCSMVISYTAIFIKLARYEKRSLKKENLKSVSYKKKVTRTMFIVVIVFIILRIPFTVLVIIRGKNLNNPTKAAKIDGYFEILWYTSHYLIFLNCAVNPLIYGLNNDNFKKAFEHTTFFPCFKRKKAGKSTIKTVPGFCCWSSKKKANLQLRKVRDSEDLQQTPKSIVRTTVVLQFETNVSVIEGHQFRYRRDENYTAQFNEFI